jgi:hypothetical protein
MRIKLYNPFKKKNMKRNVNGKVRLIPTPRGKQTSSNPNCVEGNLEVYTIVSAYGDNNMWQIINSRGVNEGWVYAYETIKIEITKEDIINKISNLLSEIDELNSKLEYLDLTESETFDEDEYKVHSVLTTLEDSKLSLGERTKIIAKFIKGC